MLNNISDNYRMNEFWGMFTYTNLLMIMKSTVHIKQKC